MTKTKNVFDARKKSRKIERSGEAIGVTIEGS